MQLTEALTSRTVRRNIEESGEIYDREYSIRTPEARTFSTSIRPEDVIPPIDDWQPTSEEDKILKTIRGKQIIAPLSQMLTNNQEESLIFNSFVLSIKKCYSSEERVDHFTHYLNYFEKFYDPEHELIAIYARIKFLIDTDESNVYDLDAFMADVKRDILFSTFARKVKALNEDNFIIHIKRNKKN